MVVKVAMNCCHSLKLQLMSYESYVLIFYFTSIWNWEEGVRLNTFDNHNPRNTHLTALEFLNPYNHNMLLLGSDDGAVRIWRNYLSDNHKLPELVTAWQALSDMLPSSKGKNSSPSHVS